LCHHAGWGQPLHPIYAPSLEITTEEEAHILGIFEAGTDLGPFQDTVYRHLPEIPSMNSFVDDQVVVGAEDGVSGFNPHGLFGATTLTAAEAVGLIHGTGGLAVAAHLDRPSFSVLSQLGFIPPGLKLDAVEGSPLLSLEQAVNTFRVETSLLFFSRRTLTGPRTSAPRRPSFS